jgi:hypothetical protein
MMTAVDLLGFHVCLKTPDGMRGARIAFSHKVRNAAETRKVLVETVQHAQGRWTGPQLAHRTSHIPSEIAVFD